MPEETQIVTEPTAPETPTPEPISIESMMGRFERPETPAPETKPETTPEPGAAKPSAVKPEPETKLETKPPTTPAKPATPPAKEDAGSLRRRLQEVSTSESTLKKEIEKIRLENQTLANRKVVTPEVEKEMEENRQHIAAMKQHLAEVAYEKSETFKNEFTVPWQRTYAKAVSIIRSWSIEDQDGNTRPATEADFRQVGSASEAERGRIASALFGPNAVTVISALNRLDEITENSKIAVANHRETFDGKQKQEREQFQAQQKAYSEHRENSRRELVEKYPEYFGEDANDPEATEALKQGFEFVDKVTSNEAITLEERAAYAEVLRARAAWFPRGHKALLKATAKIKSLESDIAKLRGGDPGGNPNLDARGEKPTNEDEVSDIEGMAARLEQRAKMG